MPITALALVLVAALIHAGWNLFAKSSGGDLRLALLSPVAVVLVWSPVGLWAAWREVPGYGLWQWSLIGASGAVHAVYFVTLLRGYRLSDLSVVYPLARGTGPLLTALLATTWLGETLGRRGWAGVLAIVLGILLIAGGPLLWQALRAGTADAAERRRLRTGLLYGALTGVCIAGYTVIDGVAVQRAGVSPICVDYLGNLARIPITGLWWWLLSRRRPATPAAAAQGAGQGWAAAWRSALWIGLVSPVSYVMVLYAATLAPLSHVAPARELSMLFATLLAGRWLQERDRGWRLLGALCLAGGVMALAWR